jgi:Arc/MetJ-type ribon-helix-helix transcriptional regulator
MTKITIRIERRLLEGLDSTIGSGKFPNRSAAIGDALHAMLRRLNRNRLREQCAKLDARSERALADEGLSGDLADWPEY